MKFDKMATGLLRIQPHRKNLWRTSTDNYGMSLPHSPCWKSQIGKRHLFVLPIMCEEFGVEPLPYTFSLNRFQGKYNWSKLKLKSKFTMMDFTHTAVASMEDQFSNQLLNQPYSNSKRQATNFQRHRYLIAAHNTNLP